MRRCKFQGKIPDSGIKLFLKFFTWTQGSCARKLRFKERRLCCVKDIQKGILIKPLRLVNNC